MAILSNWAISTVLATVSQDSAIEYKFLCTGFINTLFGKDGQALWVMAKIEKCFYDFREEPNIKYVYFKKNGKIENLGSSL